MSNRHNNTRTALYCVAVVALMGGLSYAAVPLYQIFCQVTGFGGTTQRVEALAGRVLDRDMNVRFDSNTSSALAWDFEPVQREVTLKVGAKGLAFYRATNTSGRELTGTATFNVSPPTAGAYFSKVECFCFTEQTLQPGESVDMPIMFFIDPDIEHDEDLAKLRTITRFFAILFVCVAGGLVTGCLYTFTPTPARPEPQPKLVEYRHDVAFPARRFSLSREQGQELEAFIARVGVGYGDRVYLATVTPQGPEGDAAARLAQRRAGAKQRLIV